MRPKTFLLLLLAALLAAPSVAWATPGRGYDEYKYAQDPPGNVEVPDCDKPVMVCDNSCWLGVAANMLAAGGWGSGAAAQARAMGIYNTMKNHFVDINGLILPGWSSVAINWWLYTHGCNPDSGSYNPAISYNEVTVIDPDPFLDIHYDSLLDELDDCQYVGVSFTTGMDVGHEITLVGGNYSPAAQPDGDPQISVWHDTDNNDMPTPTPPALNFNDDEHTNIWVGPGPGMNQWIFEYRQYPNPEDPEEYVDLTWEPKDATILCDGLTKPADAVENYDVAYYKDMDQNGNLYNVLRQAGAMKAAYTNPAGLPYAEWVDQTVFLVPNLMIEEKWKEIWILVDFIERGVDLNPAYFGIDHIYVEDDKGHVYVPIQSLWDDSGGQLRLHFVLDDQPAWEKIIFPHISYNLLYDIRTGLGGPVKDWNIATICVPDPATLGLLGMGLVVVFGRRRR